jgi:ribulose-5-phosphate 4-epimerase/fuculose-1-phosphate aldolase
MDSKNRAILEDLVTANRILAREGVLDAFGHVSVRHPTNAQRYFLARSISPELVSIDDLMEFTLDDEPVAPDGRAMYAERAIHGAIYRTRKDVHAICHNHAHSLIPFGVTGAQLRPIFHMGSVIGNSVPVWDSREHFGDTNLLVTDARAGGSLAAALGGEKVVLMRGHGAAVTGGALRETVFTSVYLQTNADLLLKANSLGAVTFLTPGEVDLAAEHLRKPLSQDRAWEYWSRRIST